MAPVGTTTSPPDEVEEGEGIPPAMFITVKYGYELEKKFNTDVPCKMLMARIIKTCPLPEFPDLPADFAKYDLKLEGQAGVGVMEQDMARGRKVLESRGTYIYCGYDEDNQEYELCMPEPKPEGEEGGEAGA